jgi:hypothetical protein
MTAERAVTWRKLTTLEERRAFLLEEIRQASAENLAALEDLARKHNRTAEGLGRRDCLIDLAGDGDRQPPR